MSSDPECKDVALRYGARKKASDLDDDRARRSFRWSHTLELRCRRLRGSISIIHETDSLWYAPRFDSDTGPHSRTYDAYPNEKASEFGSITNGLPVAYMRRAPSDTRHPMI